MSHPSGTEVVRRCGRGTEAVRTADRSWIVTGPVLGAPHFLLMMKTVAELPARSIRRSLSSAASDAVGAGPL